MLPNFHPAHFPRLCCGGLPDGLKINLTNSRLSILTDEVRRRVSAPWIAPWLLLLALPAAVQAQFNDIITNGTVAITCYYGPGGSVTISSTIAGRLPRLWRIVPVP